MVLVRRLGDLLEQGSQIVMVLVLSRWLPGLAAWAEDVEWG
jgi:hypothetical protein